MKELSINEKIEIINDSKNLESVSILALPKVFGSSYYFISYSHKDYKKVYTDILRLQELGLNIWYDRGLQPGKSWEDYADEAIAKYNCIGVIFYMSENSIVSDAVVHEIEYVKKIGKDFLSINLPIEQNNENKGKVLSVPKMLELDNISNKIKDDNAKFLKNIFNDSVIYIDYNFPIEKKMDSISQLKKPPLFNFKVTNKLECELTSINSIDMKKLELSESEIINDTPHSISSIGNCAFANCKQLEEVILPNNCVSLGEQSFFNCQMLNKISFPNTLERIKEGTFGKCINLTEISLPEKINYIDERAFEDCISLRKLELPTNIISIGDGAFKGTSLKEITMKNNTIFTPSSYYIENNCIIEKQINPKYRKKKSVLQALKNNKLYQYKIVGGVSIGDIIFPNNTIEIKPFAYSNCINLKSIIIPPSINIIGCSSFSNCNNLEQLNFVKNESKQFVLSENPTFLAKELIISKSAFENCYSIKEIHFPKELIHIGYSSFANCSSIKTIEFEKGSHLNRIFNNAFEDCTSLEEITIPASVTNIGFRAFAGCTNLKKVTFEENSQLKYIDDYAFADCKSLKEISLPNKLITLNNFTFSSCISLENVYIPKSIKNIKHAFIGCENLKNIYFSKNTKLKHIYVKAFEYSKDVCIHYPKSKKQWDKIFQTNFVATIGTHSSMYDRKTLEKSDKIDKRIEEYTNISFKD